MKHLTFLLISLLLISACAQGDDSAPTPAAGFQVMTTTTILADVVRQVGGQYVSVSSLLPPGADPHAFDPTPQDIARLNQADLIFINGFGLEQPIEKALAGSNLEGRTVTASQGINPRLLSGEEEHEDEGDDENHVGEYDPHVWLDPKNVIIWVENIAAALSEADPDRAAQYQANAQVYRAGLEELDDWIVGQVDNVPPENRMIVTDHQVFGYFADRYGFTQVGTLLPGASTLAEPSAQELAALETRIRELGVPAIFAGNTVNQNLARRVAEDTGVEVVTLYTGSLTEGGEASTYISYMRANVQTMVSALE